MASIELATISRTNGSISAMRFGVNADVSRPLSGPWSGGSEVSGGMPTSPTPSIGGTVTNSEENTSGLRAIAAISA
jgi:hypothetical protein